MNKPENLDALRSRFFTGEHLIATVDCLDADTVAALADSTLDAESRALALRHLARCAICREAVASVARALEDGPVTREIELVEGRRHRWPRLRYAFPLAAAAVLLLLLRSPADDGAGRHRGGDGSDALAPVPVAPVGSVAAAHVLVWTSVAGADAYRVTLFDAQGHVAYEARAADTTATLPDSIILVAGWPYLWKVEARTGFDRWVTSKLVEFSVAAPPP